MASAKPIGRSWYFAISASRSACGSLRRSRLPRTAVYAETQAIADLVAESSTEALKVLDIAAGHGLFGITIAQRNVRAEIVAVVLEFVPNADRVSPPVPARFKPHDAGRHAWRRRVHVCGVATAARRRWVQQCLSARSANA